MRRASPLLLAAAMAACVAVQTLPDPRGAVRPGQRLVVLVTQAPGPWIVSETDSKAATAAKLLPVGTLVQGMQEERILEASQDLAQYLPRPRYDQAVEEALAAVLRSAHDGPVQTFASSGLDPGLWRGWYKASDPLDWRRRYYSPDPDAPAPRDFAKILALDDAIVADVNVSFGTAAAEDGSVQPALSAATRVYRAGTAQLLVRREDFAVDKTSTTLTDFRLQPAELTRRLEALAPELGRTVGERLAGALALTPPAPTVVPTLPPGPPSQP